MVYVHLIQPDEHLGLRDELLSKRDIAARAFVFAYRVNGVQPDLWQVAGERDPRHARRLELAASPRMDLDIESVGGDSVYSEVNTPEVADVYCTDGVEY